jgi:hypothetical protein
MCKGDEGEPVTNIPSRWLEFEALHSSTKRKNSRLASLFQDIDQHTIYSEHCGGFSVVGEDAPRTKIEGIARRFIRRRAICDCAMRSCRVQRGKENLDERRASNTAVAFVLARVNRKRRSTCACRERQCIACTLARLRRRGQTKENECQSGESGWQHACRRAHLGCFRLFAPPFDVAGSWV